jgi:hypothetical protein
MASLLSRALVRDRQWRDRGPVAQRLYPGLPKAGGSTKASTTNATAPQPKSIAAAIYPHLPQGSKPEAKP